MTGPLAGIRVLDLSRSIAGPYGAMILGDLGAEVIKVESPEGETSRLGGGPTYRGESFFYLSFNRNKKNLVLDFDTDSGKEAFYDLVRISDIVWDNFRHGATERAGIDYDTLKEINPRIICCSITGYGNSGPSKDRPSFDVVMLATSGVLSVTGEPGGRPVRPGPPIGDMAGGLFSVIGVLAALAERERTGQGQRIDISLLGSCISLLSYQLSHYFCSGVVPGPLGNSGHVVSVPYGVYKTKKGYIALGPCWPRITRAIGAEWMAEDERFKEPDARLKNRNDLNAIVEEYLAKAEAEDWLEIFKVEDIPADIVRSLDEVVVDPQVASQKMILSMKHPLGGEIKLAGNPVKMAGISEEEFTPPPTLDQHGYEIFSVLLGYSEAKINRLKQEEKEHTEQRLSHVVKRI